ncbi:fumarylacetoacetate hydrolase family protein [Paractinoplanes ferrugineus]|uniref:Hydratase/decarboxylase n=1 Tax=Paractinoplanes ferrugineus TaxID=113564 RepID=A0A919J5J5_9ACTN|nr:fumarylacetoacetate hydrolase family protein [Actinoplanes ferrugineus]GIE13747.1 putative hydratase/decarboxylase [Actinoplanes ferrugineus]
MNSTAEAAASRLADARRAGKPCAPVRDLIDAQDVALAYRVQRLGVDRRTAAGERIAGRKIGLTAPVVQQQLGVDQPDFGVLFDTMDVSALAVVPVGGLLQPKVEAEVAFRLGADLGGDLSPATVRAAVAHAEAAIEIVDSRIADWDISIADTVADNASSGLFVLSGRPVPLSAFEPADVVMRMTVDGAPASAGTGRDCLGDPLAALAWLARTARDLGDPLRAGEIVLSGALGRMVPVGPGSRVRAEISSLGSVDVVFGGDLG